jgi:hypothetical protein
MGGREMNTARTVIIAPAARWGGEFKILEVRREFKNGKVAVRVNFYGKSKVFHVKKSDIREA